MSRLFRYRKHLFLAVLILISHYILCKNPVNWCSGIHRRYDGALSFSYNNTEDYLINTPGCYIPSYTKNFSYIIESSTNDSCGERAVFVDKIGNYQIKFRIDRKKMDEYSERAKFKCCYKFAIRSTIPNHEDTHLMYTDCRPFKDGTKADLVQEVITVTCSTYKSKNSVAINIYKDAYLLVKRLKVNNTQSKTFWNVVLIGLDTMSRARVYDTMPLTTKYLQTYNWIDYKGYQKVDYNTFPNLVSVLTGKKMSTIYRDCENGLSKCADYFIWSKYKESGFVTAYGEDYIELPDTFSKYQGFKIPPTDHYMRPFYLTGEKRNGSLVCTKKKPSATHLLDYAHCFTEAYRKDRFFGLFWINSYCHTNEDSPSLLDAEIIALFEKLRRSGVLNNTFVIFFSDHGTRSGKMRLPIESYYDERLPMLFIWVPDEFRLQNMDYYHNLQLNQGRLVTPYDLYLTLDVILTFSNDARPETHSEACPQCTSLFTEVPSNRKCADAGVSEKWCSCHNMSEISLIDKGANHSLHLAISHIQNISKSVETIPCKVCKPLRLGSVLRSHTFRDEYNNTNYVVAFIMSPHDIVFEVIVLNKQEQLFSVIHTHCLTAYNTRGNCVIDPNKRPYCVCQTNKKCNYRISVHSQSLGRPHVQPLPNLGTT